MLEGNKGGAKMVSGKFQSSMIKGFVGMLALFFVIVLSGCGGPNKDNSTGVGIDTGTGTGTSTGTSTGATTTYAVKYKVTGTTADGTVEIAYDYSAPKSSPRLTKIKKTLPWSDTVMCSPYKKMHITAYPLAGDYVTASIYATNVLAATATCSSTTTSNCIVDADAGSLDSGGLPVSGNDPALIGAWKGTSTYSTALFTFSATTYSFLYTSSSTSCIQHFSYDTTTISGYIHEVFTSTGCTTNVNPIGHTISVPYSISGNTLTWGGMVLTKQ